MANNKKPAKQKRHRCIVCNRKRNEILMRPYAVISTTAKRSLWICNGLHPKMR